MGNETLNAALASAGLAVEPDAGAECRIYVACLASYNNGRLHGAWIDCDGKDADELQDEVNAILRASPYPNVTVSCPTCDGAADKAGDVAIFQDGDAWTDEALLASYAQEMIEDCYSESLEGLPDFIKYNIDWRGIGRDLQLGGDVDVAAIDGQRFLVTNASEF